MITPNLTRWRTLLYLPKKMEIKEGLGKSLADDRHTYTILYPSSSPNFFVRRKENKNSQNEEELYSLRDRCKNLGTFNWLGNKKSHLRRFWEIYLSRHLLHVQAKAAIENTRKFEWGHPCVKKCQLQEWLLKKGRTWRINFWEPVILQTAVIPHFSVQI